MIQRLPNLLIRIPHWPLDRGLSNINIHDLLNKPDFLQAIYIASPALYYECIRLNDAKITEAKAIQKIHRTLLKYLLRMSSRSTPFGTFAGCTMAKWGNITSPLQHVSMQKHTRLDMDYLCALEQYLIEIPEIRKQLKFYNNTSLYQRSTEWRYVEYQYRNGKRQHQISAAAADYYLNEVLSCAKGGATYLTLCSLLACKDINAEEAAAYIDELIKNRILVSELEPAITGRDIFQNIVDILNRLKNDKVSGRVAGILNNTASLLKEADMLPADKAVVCYHNLAATLRTLRLPLDENKLLQVDCAVAAYEPPQVNEKYGETLDEYVQLLSRLTPLGVNPNLDKFRTRFYERYEDREVPLLEVLDTESGIGYLDLDMGDITPLVDRLHISPGGATQLQTIEWSSKDQLLLEKLIDAGKNNFAEVILSDEDINQLIPDGTPLKNNEPDWNRLPPSFSFMFRIVKKDTAPDDYILPETIGGSSAINLLARFGHTNPDIENHIKEIGRKEQEMNPDTVLAEIIHLPESRIGNILLHPPVRDMEIPYLAASSLPFEKQLPLQDLYISVRGNEIVLRSETLGKRIVPRLSTAHNFSFNAQPVYQFLCDLQTQGLQSALHFDWGNLDQQHKWLPRLVYKKIIVAPAQWRLSRNEYGHVVKLTGEERAAAFSAFKKKWSIPRHIILADGDNELLIDTESRLHTDLLFDSITKRTAIRIKEFLFPSTDQHPGNYNCQYVAAYMKTTATYDPYLKTPPNRIATHERRDFTPGSEWLYFKWYCGYKTADAILEHHIAPLVKRLRAEGLIDNWFFVRYADPQFHLRLRFHLLQPQQNLGIVMSQIENLHSDLQQEKLIWKVQIDTYTRELERYGEPTIRMTEALFGADSDCLLGMLQHTSVEERGQLRWIWSLLNIDCLLDDFQYQQKDKLELLRQLKSSFAHECNADKHTHNQLSELFRNNRNRIEEILQYKVQEHNYPALMVVLYKRSLRIKPVATRILSLCANDRVQIDALLSSYIHMVMNRICTSKMRLQEMAVYDFLHRYYVAQKARASEKQNARKFISCQV